MAWSAEHWRGASLAVLGGLSLACFVGADTMGLPCGQDADCGPKLTCHASGCCGGPCSDGTSPTTSSTTDPTTASTTSPPTGTTDPASEGSDETSTPYCGDGFHDPGLGEECDEGEGSNRDTAVDDDWPTCLADCTRPPFYWVAGAPASVNGGWCSVDDEEPMCREWDDDSVSWVSGRYPLEGRTCEPTINPLISDWFEIPAPPEGAVPVVSVKHEWAFNTCSEQFYDGGRVLLELKDGPTVHLLPDEEDLNQQPLTCLMGDPCSPFCASCPMPSVSTREPYFVGSTEMPETTERQLAEAWVGMARLVIEAGYDCFNCNPLPSNNAWEISAVHVGFRDADG